MEARSNHPNYDQQGWGDSPNPKLESLLTRAPRPAHYDITGQARGSHLSLLIKLYFFLFLPVLVTLCIYLLSTQSHKTASDKLSAEQIRSLALMTIDLKNGEVPKKGSIGWDCSNGNCVRIESKKVEVGERAWKALAFSALLNASKKQLSNAPGEEQQDVLRQNLLRELNWTLGIASSPRNRQDQSSLGVSFSHYQAILEDNPKDLEISSLAGEISLLSAAHLAYVYEDAIAGLFPHSASSPSQDMMLSLIFRNLAAAAKWTESDTFESALQHLSNKEEEETLNSLLAQELDLRTAFQTKINKVLNQIYTHIVAASKTPNSGFSPSNLDASLPIKFGRTSCWLALAGNEFAESDPQNGFFKLVEKIINLSVSQSTEALFRAKQIFSSELMPCIEVAARRCSQEKLFCNQRDALIEAYVVPQIIVNNQALLAKEEVAGLLDSDLSVEGSNLSNSAPLSGSVHALYSIFK